MCCGDVNEDRVVVDYGDQCCAGVPYSSHGAQLCCNGNVARSQLTSTVEIQLQAQLLYSRLACFSMPH